MLFFYAVGLGVMVAVARLFLGLASAPPDRADAPAPLPARPAPTSPASSGAGLRWWPVAVLALVLQVFLTWRVGGVLAEPWRVAALWLTHGVLAVVLLANVRRPGMAWLLVGMGLNFLVMAANGGLMPVSPETMVRGGRERVLERTELGQAPAKKNVLLREEETRLALLSDRLVVPGHNGAFSVGDVLIAAGIVLALGGFDLRQRSSGGEAAGGAGGVHPEAQRQRTQSMRRARPTWGQPLVT